MAATVSPAVVSPVLDAALANVLSVAPEAWPQPTPEQNATVAALPLAYASGQPAEIVALAHALEQLTADWPAAGGPQAGAHARLSYAIHRRR